MLDIKAIEQKRINKYHYTKQAWLVGILGFVVFRILLSLLNTYAMVFSYGSWFIGVYFFTWLGFLLRAIFYSCMPFISDQEENELFLSPVAQVFGKEVQYQAHSGYPEETIRGLNLFQYFTFTKNFGDPYVRYTSEDQIEGTWKDIHFSIADASISYVVSNGKSTSTVYIFQGILVRAEFPFDFDGQTWLQPNHFAAHQTKPAQDVHLESSEFSKNYRVYSTSQIGARMALQTDTMTVLTKLADSFQLSSEKPRVVFVDKEVWIALPVGANWMDMEFSSPITSQLEKTKVILTQVSKLLLSLKLNQIGTRVKKVL